MKAEEIKRKNQRERIENECRKTWKDNLSKDINETDKLLDGVNQIVDEYKKVYTDFNKKKKCTKNNYDNWKEEIDLQVPEEDEERKRIDGEMNTVGANLLNLKNIHI